MIEAAGGVVLRTSRPSDDGLLPALAGFDSLEALEALEVLVVHRPDRGDWSLPKGKRRRRETALACALREVHEETGFRCEPHLALPSVRYTDRRGRPRRVRYWTMQTVGGAFVPNDEVDQICWMTLDTVGHLLTYEREIALVRGLRLSVPHVA